MLWACLAAMAPVTYYGSAQNPLCYPDKRLPKNQYNINIVEEAAASTIKPGVSILIVLLLYPVILFYLELVLSLRSKVLHIYNLWKRCSRNPRLTARWRWGDE